MSPCDKYIHKHYWCSFYFGRLEFILLEWIYLFCIDPPAVSDETDEIHLYFPYFLENFSPSHWTTDTSILFWRCLLWVPFLACLLPFSLTNWYVCSVVMSVLGSLTCMLVACMDFSHLPMVTTVDLLVASMAAHHFDPCVIVNISRANRSLYCLWEIFSLFFFYTATIHSIFAVWSNTVSRYSN